MDALRTPEHIEYRPKASAPDQARDALQRLLRSRASEASTSHTDTGKGKASDQPSRMYIDERQYTLDKNFKDHNREPNFSQARNYAFQIMKSEAEMREYHTALGRFQPSEEELRWGIHHDQIEPQVREAVFELLKKGYQTNSSGFGSTFRKQQIDGPFSIDNHTKSELAKIGVSVEIGPMEQGTAIFFDAKTANLKDIRDMWKKITGILPDKGFPAPEDVSQEAQAFRAQYTATREPSETDSSSSRHQSSHDSNEPFFME